MKIIKKMLCIILALVSILALNACGGNKLENIDNRNTIEAMPAEDIDLPTLFDDYYNNELAADEKYIGRRFRVVTEFDNATENSVDANHYEYYPNSTSLNDDVFIRFDLKYRENQRDTVLTFSNGDRIVFEGTLTNASSHSYELFFEDVVFID